MNNIISPDKIRDFYNDGAQKDKDPVHARWGNMPIKRRHYKQTEKTLLNELSKLKNLGDVLEIGCGPATWTGLYIDMAERVTLLDISEGVLEHAKRRLGEREHVQYMCGDFNKINFPEDSGYDVIVSIRAWEYISNKNEAVKRVYNLLKPGGRLYIITKNRGWMDNRHRVNMKNVEVSKLPIEQAMQMDLMAWPVFEAMYKEAGFKDVATYPVVIGSYHRLFNHWLGLTACDIFHKFIYAYPISKWHEPLAESYLIVGVKPS